MEIIASRIIAPVFGSSIYVWGRLIGAWLGALAVGFAAGGRAADRWPAAAVFAGVIFLAGALVFPIPVVAPSLLSSLSAADLGPRAGPFAASAVLFFLPAAVMGMVSPFAVRLRAQTVATIGNVAGVLYALSTLGSIAGTLLASFVLLTVWPVWTIVHLLGGSLLVLATLLWFTRRRSMLVGLAAAVAALLIGLPVFLVPSGAREAPQYERDTVYHRITISDEGGVRFLKLDNYWQSAQDLADPRRTVLAYLIDTIPFHLATREFFLTAKAHLAPGGVLRSNVIGALAGSRSGLFRAIYKTMASVFPPVYVFPVVWGRFDGPAAFRNIILVAADQPRSPRDALLAVVSRARTVPGVTLPRFDEAARDLYDGPIETRDVPVLTDDFAPVDTLIQGR